MYNVIGQSFPNYVKQQLKARENTLKQLDRVNSGDNFTDYQDLMYLSNKTGWVTLRSSVQLEKDKDLYNYFTSKAPFSNSTEKDLAKYYVLNGGLSYSNASTNPNGKSNLRSGFLDSKGNSFEGSYGMGGTDEQGFRPMPGIQSMNLVFKTQNGALREATIRVKAFNLFQLEVIDTLYMKLGMSAVLEWGHTPYLKNDGSLETKTAIIPFYEIKNGKEGVLKAMAKQREVSCGNYDGLFGKVSNFDWAANPDGTYDCTIKILGLGDVIETLKMNVTNGPTFTTPIPLKDNTFKPILTTDLLDSLKTIGGVNPNKISSLYTNAIDVYKQNAIKNPPSSTKDKKLYAITTTPTITQTLFSEGVMGRYFDKGPIAKTSGSLDIVYGAKGFNADLMAGRVESSQIPTVSGDLFKRLIVPYSVNVGETTSQGDASPSDNNTLSVYLTLGHLLALIVNNSMLYEGDSGTQKPYISIDFNDQTNFCFTTPYQVSVNPLVCLIPYEPGNYDTTKADLIKDTPGNFITKDNNLLSTYMANHGLGFKTSDNPNKGYLMRILVHVDYATELFNSFINDKNSEVPLLPYMENLLSGIGEALGRINLFRVGFDDEANVIRIYDDQLIPGEKQEEPTMLNLFGTKSLYRDYSLQSNISNNIATTIAVSNSTSGEGSGIDGTGFSKIAKDRGAYDRILKKEGVGNYRNTSVFVDDTPKLNSIREHLYQIYTQATISKANVDSVKTVYNDRCNKLKANNTATRGLPIIPVDFNVTMEGVSGIAKLQVFTIPDALLPRAYSVGVKGSGNYKVAFVVYGLEHSIENNTWTTKIRAGMVNSKPTLAVETTTAPPKANSTTTNNTTAADKATVNTTTNSETLTTNTAATTNNAPATPVNNTPPAPPPPTLPMYQFVVEDMRIFVGGDNAFRVSIYADGTQILQRKVTTFGNTVESVTAATRVEAQSTGFTGNNGKKYAANPNT
jgi:hypothetical protein